MSHNSREAFFLGEELLLDFAVWIDLTSSNDNMSISSLEHFGSLKRAGDLRVYQGFMMPLNHQAGMQGTLKQGLKILVDRALRQHALFPFDARSIHVLCFTSQ